MFHIDHLGPEEDCEVLMCDSELSFLFDSKYRISGGSLILLKIFLASINILVMTDGGTF